jgi:hypothetical protein
MCWLLLVKALEELVVAAEIGSLSLVVAPTMDNGNVDQIVGVIRFGATFVASTHQGPLLLPTRERYVEGRFLNSATLLDLFCMGPLDALSNEIFVFRVSQRMWCCETSVLPIMFVLLVGGLGFEPKIGYDTD